MISLLGRTLVLLALGAAAVGAGAGLLGGLRKSLDALKLARWMAYLTGGAFTAATLLMEVALITHDFSVSYVAKVGSLATPLPITIVSLWSSLEGSILYWGCVLGASLAVFAFTTRKSDPEHSSYALGALMAVVVFFGLLVAGVGNPFVPTDLPIPVDGPGPNALLQNHILMILHPPALYMGYVGMAVPFAMAVSALLAGRLDARWMRSLRRWTMFAWAWLTLGILLGGWWSYEVLGWGGYWAWDPVENASFMPWLTATAFLHSAMLTERRGILRGWTVVLSLATFLLTMLGTFMTRSGVFNSVHSFTQSDVGPLFLGFIAVCSVISLLLLTLRIGLLVGWDRGLGGRGVPFLLNNLLFGIFTFVVLIGTVFPLLKEAFTGERLSVGEPYFNTMTLPVCIAILFLMGIGPALPWGAPGPRSLLRIGVPLAVSVVVGVVLFALGVRNGWALATFVAATFAGWATLHEGIDPALVRAKARGESIGVALGAYLWQAKQRVGAYTVHFGVVLCAIAIAASSAYKQEVGVSLPVGETVEVFGYELTYEGKEVQEQPHRDSQIAWIDVDGRHRADPRMNIYATMREPIGSPAVLSSAKEDLYLQLVRFNEDTGTVSVRVIVEPLVYWLWIGGIVIFLGGMYGLLPSMVKRREKTVAEAVAK